MSRKRKTKTNQDFSLVVKLNSRLLWRLFRYFILIDIFLMVLIFGFIIYHAERNFKSLYQTYPLDTAVEEETVDVMEDYHLSLSALPKTGAKVDLFLFYTDRIEEDAPRYLIVEKTAGSFFENMTSLTYNAYFHGSTNTYYTFTYDIGRDLHLLALVFAALFVLEGLIILGAVRSGARIIRSSLKPIYDIEVATRNLQSSASLSELNALAGRINKIEAESLNSRIPVNSAQEELKGLSAAINDLLERIEDAYRSQSRFVSDASHELRTPISVIQGYANLLDRWGKNDEKTMEEAITAIKNEADSMKDLVEQLLFLARGDNETMAIHKENFNVSLLTEEVYKESQMIDINHKICFSAEKSLFVNADAQLIKQALRILVDNSIKYTPPNERITVKVERQDADIAITIQDNGIGMVPEDLPYIFDRFYRSDDSRARKTGGTGLGLSIAKWIIHRHEGHMEVLSRKDFGTRITVVLPREEQTNDTAI